MIIRSKILRVNFKKNIQAHMMFMRVLKKILMVGLKNQKQIYPIENKGGSSARYATANINAFSQLAWTADDIEVLTEQWRQTVGIREIPGGYYTGRHITNAVRKVINDQEDPRETIIDYTITINEEIAKKRSEFGLPLE